MKTTLLIALCTLFCCIHINGKRLDDGYYDIATYTNCNGLADDYYDIQVIPTHTINVKCSNQYMIIDVSHDDTWYHLFSSFKSYHQYIIGPVANDHVNWESFIPSLPLHHFLVSPDCTVCDATSSLNSGLYQDQSAYYMNQIASGCFHKNRGLPACDMDQTTYECKICEWTEGTVRSRPYSTIDDYTDDDNTGICAFSIRPSNFIVATEFTQCLNYQTSAFKPSLGTNGRHCQCVKTDTPNGYIHKRKTNALDTGIESSNAQMAEDDTSDDLTYLYQSDFDHGTYRIQTGGTYLIMEDIEFDFNGNMNAPNAIGSYMPSCEDSDMYPGACSTSGPYFMGFFAGITIETTQGVILDLNDHTIGMSLPYFYQQGFFSVISLSSQPFEPMHGPGNFGVHPIWAENVVIRNGVIGRSSHHGIHGNNNKNIEIMNLRVKHFVTHGIQLNGFTDITLKDIDIGPSNDMIQLNGNYIQMRALLPNLRALYNKPDVKHKTFSFSGRKHEVLTLEELVEERLVPMMDEAFKSCVVNDYNANKRMASAMEQVFMNHGSNGIPYGAVVYGLFLNYPTSGIFGWHVSDLQSNGAVMENINIHDLYHHAEEILGLTTNKHGISNALNGPLSAVSLVGQDMMEQISRVIESKSGTFHADYVGDIVTDIHFAYYRCAYDDWDMFPGTPYYGEEGELMKWAFGETEYEDVVSTDRIQSEEELNELITCNGDRMQHPLKGIIGVKISGVQNVKIKGYLSIDNLHDSSSLGSTLCGAYSKANFGQQLPYSLGFSGNMVHAVDIAFSSVVIETDTFKVSNIISDSGLAYGFSAWYKSEIELNAADAMDFDMFNIKAGSVYLDAVESANDARFQAPNHKPQACGIRIHQSDALPVVFEVNDESRLNQQCIEGISGCEEDSIAFTHVGSVNNKACEDLRIPSHDEVGRINANRDKVVARPEHFGNTLIMAAISLLLMSVIALYQCCFRDTAMVIHEPKSAPVYTVYGSF